MNMKKPKPGTIAAYLVLSLFSIVMLFPFVWMLSSSLKDATQIFKLKLFPDAPTLDNYRYILFSESSKFPRWFLNSAIVAVCTTVSVLFFDSLLGYTLSKYRFPGKNIIFMLIVSTLMIPTEMLVIPWYAMARSLKWVNTYWGIMFPGMISAFGVFLMRQFMQTIPDDLIDAARVDGRGEFMIFLTVVLPLVTPALATLAIFNFIGNWNAFLWPLIAASKPRMFTLPVGLANFSGEAGSDWHYIMTGAAVAMAPLVAVFLLFQKQIVRGIAMTGLKG
ncbi:MAG: carbohydrate ABC transporter permease [Spirochaetia bacterium]|jgi:multiple sugar transport system permease protein|nr:carbohydrate ABC transporter permease [Spirochaetia bacterium]MCE1208503.1 carbohydrate ABC transporter permease [Spirochaetia bacterium]VBB41238.1 Binding-protein-dependent transport systems inner membrane component [uncultured Spirochaetota bacterium]HOI22576.1 carbohydrate ABC transporter permease [Spirochaetales bacterium]